MLIRVLRAVLLLSLVRVLNLTTEVNVRALSFILVPLKRFMSCKVNYFWLSFNVKLTELAVSIIKGLRMIRLLCWRVIASACFRMNEKFKSCRSRPVAATTSFPGFILLVHRSERDNSGIEV